MGGRRGRRQNRGGDLRYNMEISLEEAYAGRARRSTSTRQCPAKPAPEAAPKQVRVRKPVRPVRAPERSVRNRASSRSNAPARLSRLRPAHPQPLQALPRQRPCAEGAHACGQHPPRRRGRHPHPPHGRRPGGLNGGPPGDLYIFISITSHPIFQRDGHDLHCRAPVSFITAALGAASKFPPATVAARRSIFPRAPRPAGRSAFAARACLCCAAAHGGRPLCRNRRRDSREADAQAERASPFFREGGRNRHASETKASSPGSRNSVVAPKRRDTALKRSGRLSH